MVGITVDVLLDQGPEATRAFIHRPHTRDVFDPTFSWLLLAEATGFEADSTVEEDPIRAARWAEIAAVLYELLLSGLRPEDTLGRRSFSRAALHYRERATGVVTPANSHPPGQTILPPSPIPSA